MPSRSIHDARLNRATVLQRRRLMSGCSSGSFVIEAPSLASPLWGETRSRTAFAVKTGTRELIVPASLLRRTCVRLDSGRMPNHLLDRVTQPRANSTKIAALHSFAALASRVPKSFRRGPPSEQGGSADDPAGATWHARRSGISNGLGECWSPQTRETTVTVTERNVCVP
jgi:hypothetical protein